MPRSSARIAGPVLAIGDVHGMAEELAQALADAGRIGAFPLLLGDLVDKGPDSVAVLRIVIPRLEAGELAMVRGNHDERLLRSLTRPEGKKVRVLLDLLSAPDGAELARTASQALAATPYWITLPGHLLVHGAFHPDMLTCTSGGCGPQVPGRLRALALYGETDGRLTAEGFPLRTYGWVDSIPDGLTVVVGHDTRQLHAPLAITNAAGGRAVFLDTGAAKGGRLSTWLIGA